MTTSLKGMDPLERLYIQEGRNIVSEYKKYNSRIKFYGITFITLIAVGIGILYYLSTSLNNVEPATNRAAGEFAVEPGFTSTGVVIDQRCNGPGNTCTFGDLTVSGALEKCSGDPLIAPICNRFIYNQNEKTMTIVSLGSGLVSTSDSVSVFTRQQGITQSSENNVSQNYTQGTVVSSPGSLTVNTQSSSQGQTSSTTTSLSY